MSLTAFITGITGQDGMYLAKMLLEEEYIVHGLVRPSTLPSSQRLTEFLTRHDVNIEKLHLHYGDMLDGNCLMRVIKACEPDEIYNLAAQSHVHVSFDIPVYTAEVDGIGALRLLEAVRMLDLGRYTKIYQASTSELFGKGAEVPQNEKTKFHPRSPYATAKQFAFSITVNYREAYGFHASNGILFNHESPLRGEPFVTRKISMAAARYACGMGETLSLGNLNAIRDWGHAADYVAGMHQILQQPRPDDYVLATGRGTTVREFATLAFNAAGIGLVWRGGGVHEHAVSAQTGEKLIIINPEFIRPAEVDILIGDAKKARDVLGWKPNRVLEDLVDEMVSADIELMGCRRIQPVAAYV